VQDAVLTFRQMLSGWPSYEKGTAITCYLMPGVFGKSRSNTAPMWLRLAKLFVKHCIRTRKLMRMQYVC